MWKYLHVSSILCLCHTITEMTFVAVMLREFYLSVVRTLVSWLSWKKLVQYILHQTCYACLCFASCVCILLLVLGRHGRRQATCLYYLLYKYILLYMLKGNYLFGLNILVQDPTRNWMVGGEEGGWMTVGKKGAVRKVFSKQKHIHIHLF